MKRKMTKSVLFVFTFLMIMVNVNAKAAMEKSLNINNIYAKSLNHDTIEISWDEMRYATQYQLYRAESENGDYKKIWTTQKGYFKDTKLITGQKYYYKICAMNKEKQGEFSKICCAVPELESSEILKYQSTETSVELTYSKVNGAEWYQIYRGEAETGPFEKVGESKEESFTDVGLVRNTDYYYLVKPCKDVNNERHYGEISEVKVVTSSDHEYEKVVTNPGFTELGYTTCSCKYCGDTYIEDYIDPVEDYVREEAKRVSNAVNDKISENSITFILATDMHQAAQGELWKEAVDNIDISNRHAGQAMSLIADQVEVDFFAGLGDFAWGDVNTTTEHGIKSMETLLTYLEEVRSKTKSMLIPGNHDSLLYSFELNNGYLSDDEVASMLGDFQYVDLEDKKVRIICLYTAETDSMDIIPPDNYSGGEGMSNEQLKWFAESLDLSEKEDVEEWGIIVLGHHPLDWGNNYPAANLLHAYKTGSMYSFTRNNETISYNYEGKNDAVLIAQFHGHVHNYKVDFLRHIEEINGIKKGVQTDIKRIAIPQTNFYRPNSYGGNDITEWYGIEFGEDVNYEKVQNTAEDTAFCVVTVDLDKQMIYAYHYGAGIDRVIEYGDVTEE